MDFAVFGVIALIIVLGIGGAVAILRSPFKYPYFNKAFDVSGKRKPDIENLIEDYINKGGFTEIQNHQEKIGAWKEESERKALSSILHSLREKQYLASIDDEHAFHFILTRGQTRYSQQNYVRTAYQITQEVDSKSCSIEWLQEKYSLLQSIGFEATLKEYHSKEQRKLMTKELRQQIMVRDNYTCQICGKYMPDTVGLQIDHIVPVAKGGKTVPSNLQVLCSVCNGSKSDKTTNS